MPEKTRRFAVSLVTASVLFRCDRLTPPEFHTPYVLFNELSCILRKKDIGFAQMEKFSLLTSRFLSVKIMLLG